MQLAVSLRLKARTMAVIAMALALILGTLASPARAGEDHDNLEAARASALEKVNYKIDSLEECRREAKTDAAWSIYSEGIEELGDIKERILGEDNVYEINVLKERVHGIWATTKELAAQADEPAKEDEDDAQEDEKKKDEEEAAERRKAEEDSRRREAEKAEAALREARSSTIALIETKYRLGMAAAQSAHHQQISYIYREAAMKIIDLLPDAEEADSIDELEGIAGDVWDIIHAAKEEIAALRSGQETDKEGDNEGDYDGTEEEEQTISGALDAVEARTLIYQQAVANTMDPSSNTMETGAAALEAGDELLAAIAAARLAETEEDIVSSWETVMAARNAYRITLIAHNQRRWRLQREGRLPGVAANRGHASIGCSPRAAPFAVGGSTARRARVPQSAAGRR